MVFYITIFAVLLSSCKKDYPKDTPKWLKQKIIEYKKYEDHNAFVPIFIDEYKNTSGEIIYWFYYSYRSGGSYHIYFDYYGNEICGAQFNFQCTINGEPILKGYSESRSIWVQNFTEII